MFNARPAIHLLRLAMLVGAVILLGASPSDAATVRGTFEFEKPLDNSTKVRRPIALARVEIWQKGPWSPWWNYAGATTTDRNGFMTFRDAWCDGTYAVRVFATNDAAEVWPNDVLHNGECRGVLLRRAEPPQQRPIPSFQPGDLTIS